MMILVNEIEKIGSVSRLQFETFLKLLAPFAPHMTEELWCREDDHLGKSIHLEDWPKYDENKIKDERVTIMVQVNGKVRAQFEGDAGISEEEAINIAKNKTEELLEMLHVAASVSVQEGEEGRVEVSIDTEDSSILIGYHGENLEAFQLILAFLISKELGDFQRVVVNVGDYRQRREEKLKELATRAKEEALENDGDVILSNLSSNERRIIHLFLQ